MGEEEWINRVVADRNMKYMYMYIEYLCECWSKNFGFEVGQWTFVKCCERSFHFFY